MQSDPLGMFSGQSSTYAYVNNNPLILSDDLGLCSNSDEAARCKQVAADARELCSNTSLPSGNYGFRFWNCVNKYIEDHGCGPGGTPLPAPEPEPVAPPAPNTSQIARDAIIAAILGVVGWILSPAS